MLAPGKWILYSVQEIIKGQSGSLPVMPLGYVNFKKVIFRNYADHAETVSGKVVPWLSEDYHYDLLLGLVVPTNFRYLYNSGVGLKNLRKFLRYCLLFFFYKYRAAVGSGKTYHAWVKRCPFCTHALQSNTSIFWVDCALHNQSVQYHASN